MSNSKIALLHRIVSEELGISPAALTPETGYQTIPEWDSVAHMHLIMAIEDTFGMTFTDIEIGSLTTLARIETAISTAMVAA
ncbi:acyl carrier protein [Paracoccaceae bacterium GXU_MW_L88]